MFEKSTESKKKLIARNQKVASRRGEPWKEKLKTGRLDSDLYPTRLRQERVKQNKSQTVISVTLDLSLSTYGGIERGRVPLKKILADEISKVFNMPRQKLFKEIGKNRYLALK